MTNIKFISNPGYINDLYFMFILHFNQDLWKKYINSNKHSEDMDYFHSLEYKFGNIPDELLIFFFLKSDTSAFMTKCYFLDYEELLFKDMSFKEIQNDLTDYEKVMKNVFEFYFPEREIIGNFKEKIFLKSLANLVTESDYPPLIKNCILTFFIDPDRVIQKLILELTSKDVMLTKYYEENYKTILKQRDYFDSDNLFSRIKVLGGREYDFEVADAVVISFCLLAKNTISGKLYSNTSLCLLGYDFRDCLEMLENRMTFPDMVTFGKLLSDERRIMILDNLMAFKELSTSDIALKCNQTINAVFYHLDMMNQADVLHTRNVGRTVIYRINSKYFELMREQLKKFIKKGE